MFAPRCRMGVVSLGGRLARRHPTPPRAKHRPLHMLAGVRGGHPRPFPRGGVVRHRPAVPQGMHVLVRRMAKHQTLQRRFRWHRAEDGAIVTHKNAFSLGPTLLAKTAVVGGGVALLASIAYFFYAQEEMLITGRKRFVPIPRKLEWYLGILFEQHTRANKAVLEQDHPLVKRVMQLAFRVAGAAEQLGVRYAWKVLVVESDAHEAVCLPGGVIVVSTGLVYHLGELTGSGVFESMDDALGTVLCHEVGHAVARHQVEGLALQPWAAMLGAYGRPLEFLTTYALALPYKRQQEREADEIGVHLMALANLDVEAPMKLFLNVHTSDGGIAGTHPSDNERAIACARAADVVKVKYANLRAAVKRHTDHGHPVHEDDAH